MESLPNELKIKVLRQLDPLDVKNTLLAAPSLRSLFNSFIDKPEEKEPPFYDGLGFTHNALESYTDFHTTNSSKMNLIEITAPIELKYKKLERIVHSAPFNFIVISLNKGEHNRMTLWKSHRKVWKNLFPLGHRRYAHAVQILLVDHGQTDKDFSLPHTNFPIYGKLKGVKLYIPGYLNTPLELAGLKQYPKADSRENVVDSSEDDAKDKPYEEDEDDDESSDDEDDQPRSIGVIPYTDVASHLDLEKAPTDDLYLNSSRYLWSLRNKKVAAKECEFHGAKYIENIELTGATDLMLCCYNGADNLDSEFIYDGITAPELTKLDLKASDPELFPVFQNINMPKLKDAKIRRGYYIPTRDLRESELQTCYTRIFNSTDNSDNCADYSFLEPVDTLCVSFANAPLRAPLTFANLKKLNVYVKDDVTVNCTFPAVEEFILMYLYDGEETKSLPVIHTPNLKIMRLIIDWVPSRIGSAGPLIDNIQEIVGTTEQRPHMTSLRFDFHRVELAQPIARDIEECLFGLSGSNLEHISIKGIKHPLMRLGLEERQNEMCFPELKTFTMDAAGLDESSTVSPASEIPEDDLKSICLNFAAPKLTSISIVNFFSHYDTITIRSYPSLETLDISVSYVRHVKLVDELPSLHTLSIRQNTLASVKCPGAVAQFYAFSLPKVTMMYIDSVEEDYKELIGQINDDVVVYYRGKKKEAVTTPEDEDVVMEDSEESSESKSESDDADAMDVQVIENSG